MNLPHKLGSSICISRDHEEISRLSTSLVSGPSIKLAMALSTSRPLFRPLTRLHLLSLREHVAACSSHVRSGRVRSLYASSLSVTNRSLPQPSQLLVENLTSKQRRQISAFIDLLLDWNKVNNPTVSQMMCNCNAVTSRPLPVMRLTRSDQNSMSAWKNAEEHCSRIRLHSWTSLPLPLSRYPLIPELLVPAYHLSACLPCVDVTRSST